MRVGLLCRTLYLQAGCHVLCENLKGLCHGCQVHFLNIANYAFLCATELNNSEKITK